VPEHKLSDFSDLQLTDIIKESGIFYFKNDQFLHLQLTNNAVSMKAIQIGYGMKDLKV
jgi:hypothetical protein